MAKNLKEFEFPGNEHFELTAEMQASFDEGGYVLFRNFLNAEEIERVRTSLEHPEGVRQYGYGIDDGSGAARMSMLSIWSHPGNDVSGILSRIQKVAGTTSKLLGGEVYHYHSKLIMKEAHSGGQFLWHQDYGYWYQNGNLLPDMLTCYIAVDEADEENGCMQILAGSQRAGRQDHTLRGGQHGIEEERVQHMQTLFPKHYVPLQPGDCMFFHCNVVHRSNANTSSRRRWALTLCYNTRENNPIKEHHHPCYTPLDIVPNAALASCENIVELSGKDFNDVKKDKTVKYDDQKQDGLVR